MTSLYTKPVYYTKDFDQFVDDEYRIYLNELSCPTNILKRFHGWSKTYRQYVVLKRVYLSMYSEERKLLFHNTLFKDKIWINVSFSKQYKHSETWERVKSILFNPSRFCFTTSCFEYSSNYVVLSANFTEEVKLKAIERIQKEIKSGEIFKKKNRKK